MRDFLIAQMEEAFENAVKEAFNNNPMKGTPFEGLMIQSAIGTTAKSFKETLRSEKVELGLSTNEIDSLVDEVSAKIVDKYLEF